MNDQDLASAVNHSAPEVTAPAFDKVWANAEMSYLQSRRRYAWLASAAATAAAVVIVLNIGTPPSDNIKFVELAELMECLVTKKTNRLQFSMAPASSSCQACPGWMPSS